jgi:hypothetical protein
VAKYDAAELGTNGYTEFEHTGFNRFLANMINYFSKIRNELDFSKQLQDLLEAELDRDLAMRHILTLRYSLYLIRSAAMFAHPSFSKSFCVNNGLKGLMAFLSDTTFVDKNLTTELIMWNCTRDLLFEMITRTVASLSMYCEDVKQKWTELDTVNILKEIQNELPSSCTFLCLSAIANVADDAQIERLDEIKTFSSMLIERLRIIAGYFDAKTIPKNTRTIFENNEKIIVKMAYYAEPTPGPVTKTSLFVILHGLYKLGIVMKLELYFDMKCKQYIKSIIMNSNESEYDAKYTLRYFLI